MKTRLKVVLSLVILAGAAGFFRYSARGHTGHYKMVDEVVSSYGSWVGEPMQVHGWVEPGSVDERIVDQQTVRTFVLTAAGKRIRVRSHGPKPDSFRDGSEVVAEGTIAIEQGEPVVVATSLMAKCPSHYEGARRDALFENR